LTKDFKTGLLEQQIKKDPVHSNERRENATGFRGVTFNKITIINIHQIGKI